LKPEDKPTCCNCGGPHTANYRACPWYQHVLETSQPSKKPAPEYTETQKTAPKTQSNPQITSTKTYASVTSKNSQQKSTFSPKQVIDMGSVLKLLHDLLSNISSAEDPKGMVSMILTSFITLISNQNV
jgi:hypothetical protein